MQSANLSEFRKNRNAICIKPIKNLAGSEKFLKLVSYLDFGQRLPTFAFESFGTERVTQQLIIF